MSSQRRRPSNDFMLSHSKESLLWRSLMLLSILCGQCPFVLAQQKPAQSGIASYSISGTILDPSSAVIPGAQIALVKEDGTTVAQTVADDKGSFRFDGLASGKYRVLVQ